MNPDYQTLRAAFRKAVMKLNMGHLSVAQCVERLLKPKKKKSRK